MKKRKPSARSRPRHKSHLFAIFLALALGLSAHSCTNIPAGRELVAAGVSLEKLVRELGKPEAASKKLPHKADAPAGLTASDFSACPQFFASGKPPLVVPRPTHRALCYEAFAILHSGESKTAVYVAQKLNRASVKQAHQKRTDNFFADARLRQAERATLEDYRGSDFDRGHMAPAGQMPTPTAMVQSFSLANMMPQAPQHNQGTWRVSVEDATKKYAGRASGDVYVITGPVYEPSIAKSPSIGPGKVRVPKYLFKLVYDEQENRA
ncbi:DNA/RNA non-specific endonuclease [Polaromonas naphthalenivorans]|uniref:Endonuclease n=1 Tax=Polaromonas naphthalenivorans (strain CJ2) TaxID=365044 RepID=A1VWD5_POLNA|nr:DNA/RNA non-specific endonuclease [Polaromonas naphthalenivorans CJ2]